MFSHQLNRPRLNAAGVLRVVRLHMLRSAWNEALGIEDGMKHMPSYYVTRSRMLQAGMESVSRVCVRRDVYVRDVYGRRVYCKNVRERVQRRVTLVFIPLPFNYGVSILKSREDD
jgi:hypothetical protein